VLTPGTARCYLDAIRPFVSSRLRGEQLDLAGLTSADVTGFVRACCPGLVERSVTATCSSTNSPASLRCAVTRPCCAATTDPSSPGAMADWAAQRVGLSLIPPGEPWRNGNVESFNARVRDENLNTLWSLAQARVVISDRKQDYNEHRRHSALGYQAPALRCRLHPPMNDSAVERITFRVRPLKSQTSHS